MLSNMNANDSSIVGFIRALAAQKTYMLVILFAPLLLMGVWSALQNFSERNRSYALIAEINEIQWRSSKIREDIIGISGLLALASATQSDQYKEQIEQQSSFLAVNIDALLSQPFLSSLIKAEEVDYLKALTILFDDVIIPELNKSAPDYDFLQKKIQHYQPEIWRITTLASTASYVRTRTAELAKESNFLNFTYALFIAILAVVVWWAVLLYRSRAQYNDQVRQFSLLFSHMTVTRINGLNLWAHECISPDEYPDPHLLDKARKRLEYLTVMTQWLSRIAYPNFDAGNTSYVSLASIVSDQAIRSGYPRPEFQADQSAAQTLVSEAHYHLILQELISNAQDALNGKADARIIVHASIKREWFAAKRLRVVVEDNGPGMSKEQIAKAVTPFYSTKGETFGHSGLGLYGCIGMVRTMRGKFTVTSEPGRGTRMEFSCPLNFYTTKENENAGSPGR